MRSLAALLFLSAGVVTAEAPTAAPHYKPSSRSPEMDIRTNAYGASRSAPDALRIGDQAPDFRVPIVGGGHLALTEIRASGPVVLVFYRGHW